MENYIESLEKEFSLIENGFKEEEKRALSDYRSNDKEFVKKLAFLAYNSNTYQVRMYGVFLFGYLSEQNDILTFMRDEVSKDDNWRVQEVLAKAFDEFSKLEVKKLLADLKNQGKSVIMVSHDLDFVGDVADYVSFLSDAIISKAGSRREVFSSLNFYTTQVRRITKRYLESAVSMGDIV